MGSGRLAVPADIVRIVDMVEELALAVSSPQRVDRESAARTLLSQILSDDGVVYVSDGGFISGQIIRTAINPEPVAFETGWYAHDRSGLQLLRMFEAWSRDRGAAMVRMSCNGGAAQRILERQGYRVAEISMVKKWQ